MSSKGYIDHARRSRQLTWWLVALYIAAIEMIAAVALILPLLVWDPQRIVFIDPTGYLLRYSIPVAAFAAFQIWFLYRRHIKVVSRLLNIQLPTRAEEPRLWRIVEEQTIALGIRLPKFGVIEVDALNALSVGEGPQSGLIAVTRGMLNHLDDEELAAVLAHEAAHIRNGDTGLLAISHALMRTAAILQVSNPFSFQNWRHAVLIIVLPLAFFLVLIAGAVVMTAMRLAWLARRNVKLSRDHIADGEAIRITHFPEALISALRKVRGRGAFQNSDLLDAHLFEGRMSGHTLIDDRISAISSLGSDLMQAGRIRRDTRVVIRETTRAATFGRRPEVTQWRASLLQKEKATIEEPSLRMYCLFFTDRERFWQWQGARIDVFEWREGNERNGLGLTAAASLMLVAAVATSIIFHLYTSRDLDDFARRFDPNFVIEAMDAPDGVYRMGTFPGQGDGIYGLRSPSSNSVGNSKLRGASEAEVPSLSESQQSVPGSINVLSFGVVMIFFIVLNPRLRRFLFDGWRQ